LDPTAQRKEFKRVRRDSMPKPTPAETAILQVLWRRGGCTVREVHEALADDRPSGYTTVLKLMQIMAKKGLVRRDESERSHRYEAVASRQQTQQQLLGDFVDRVFEGSAQKLIMQALSRRKSSRADLSEIRRLLDKLDGGAR
jgi:predicted transcriptional regulator